MNGQLLLAAGYREYEPNPVLDKHAYKCFAKWVRQDGEKAYHITVQSFLPIEGHPNRETIYQAHVQFDDERPKHPTVNVTVLSGWTIDEMENTIHTIWKALTQ